MTFLFLAFIPRQGRNESVDTIDIQLCRSVFALILADHLPNNHHVTLRTLFLIIYSLFTFIIDFHIINMHYVHKDQ